MNNLDVKSVNYRTASGHRAIVVRTGTYLLTAHFAEGAQSAHQVNAARITKLLQK